jgi:ParB-like chromosome segregation protein Spo0J
MSKQRSQPLEEAYQIYAMPIDQVKLNPENPRVIEDEKFEKIVQSVKEDGFMLSIRFLVVDKNNVVMGGNQRLRACQVAGLTEVYVVKADDLSEKELNDFILKDNTYYGNWDRPMVSNLYSDAELVSMGAELVEMTAPRLEVIGDIQPAIDQSDLAERKEAYDNNSIKQIVVYYPADIFDKVVESLEAIKKHMQCNENPEVLLKLLNHWEANYAN